MSYQEMPTPRLTTQEFSTSVLVLGTGWTGLRTASVLADLGYSIVLASEDEQVPPAGGGSHVYSTIPAGLNQEMQETLKRVRDHERIELLPGSRLIQVLGMPGRFTAILRSQGASFEREVGSIVLATDIAVWPLFSGYGLTPADNVLSLSELEQQLAGNGHGPLPETVAFLVGFAQEGNPLTMHRIMQSVEILEEKGCRAYVYVDNLKVAADGLEKLYKQNRDKGAIFFKLRQAPRISQSDLSITSYDPVLGRDVELHPDCIVVEEEIQANRINAELAEVLRLDPGPWGFLQEDNVHRLPVHSNREGVFIAGEAKEPQELTGIWADAANVALQVRDFLGDGEVTLPEFTGIIDKEKCCFCLTCYRCCPHGAIGWDDKPFISPAACQACGICASECPQKAIQIVEYTDEKVTLHIKEALKDVASSDGPALLAFCCQNSAQEAWSMAQSFGRPLPSGLRTIAVPCGGKVDLGAIYTAFLNGADAVAVLSCHPDNCKSVRGNTFAGLRVQQAKRILDATGLSPERLLFHTLASNMDHDLSETLGQLEQTAKELGATPLRP
jgi:heterodisulfide reductase subunit A-like polyferredoxin/coenzyme F420-reducing hydrogenase delta subunit